MKWFKKKVYLTDYLFTIYKDFITKLFEDRKTDDKSGTQNFKVFGHKGLYKQTNSDIVNGAVVTCIKGCKQCNMNTWCSYVDFNRLYVKRTYHNELKEKLKEAWECFGDQIWGNK